MSKLLLQMVNGLIGLLVVVLGTVQVVFGVNSPLYAEANLPAFPILDSNLRFFGGMGLGLGLMLLWIIPRIERHRVLFIAVWLCAWLGGVGRLISWPIVGAPSTMLISFTILEVIGAPLLIYWQGKIAGSQMD